MSFEDDLEDIPFTVLWTKHSDFLLCSIISHPVNYGLIKYSACDTMMVGTIFISDADGYKQAELQ